jgi:peptidoglycan hydrolase-like protein with peptidoglycan-binding domain
MKGSVSLSIFSYLRSFIPFSFFNKNKLYCLLLCSSTPFFLALPSVASVTVGQQIAQVNQVNSVGGINRPSLKVGSQGEVVSELQAALKLLGYYSGAVDGKFSETTASAVSEFKQAAGLAPDGVVDATTWQRLFPGEKIASSTNTSSASVSSTTTSSTSTTSRRSNFPIPSQVAADLPRPIVESNSEPRPTNSRRTENNRQLETVRTTSVIRSSATTRSQPSNRSSQNTTSTSTTRSNTTNRSGRTNNSNTTQTTTRTSTTNNRSGRSNSSSSTQTTRTSQPRSSQQRPGIQYTAAGFPILRLGMQGEEVLELQRRLQRFGYLKTTPDGDFGAATETAVKALQTRFGIEADGVAGGETWEILTRRRNRSQ